MAKKSKRLIVLVRPAHDKTLGAKTWPRKATEDEYQWATIEYDAKDDALVGFVMGRQPEFAVEPGAERQVVMAYIDGRVDPDAKAAARRRFIVSWEFRIEEV